MRGIPDEMLAALSKEEIGMLWRVFETVCIEYDIPRDGEQIQHLARFLMREFRRPLDEEALLSQPRLSTVTTTVDSQSRPEAASL